MRSLEASVSSSLAIACSYSSQSSYNMKLPDIQRHALAVAFGGIVAAAGAYAAVSLIRAFNSGVHANSPDNHLKKTACILLDNGSLRAASFLSLRDMASKVEARVGIPVFAASARMSNRIAASELGGTSADVLESCVPSLWRAGFNQFLILPAFMGPSETLSQFVPEVFAKVESRLRVDDTTCKLHYHVGRPIVDVAEVDNRTALALVERIRGTVESNSLQGPIAVAVCDHGSPSIAVNAVRNHVAAQVRTLLLGTSDGDAAGIGPRVSVSAAPGPGPVITAVTASSMERRPGPEFDFNEPLLERLLRSEGYNDGNVVIGMVFISPGKHAGDGGDVAEICRAAEAEATAAGRRLRCHMTPLLGSHQLFVDILVNRCEELVKAAGVNAVAAGQ